MKLISGFELNGQAVGETNISHFQLRIKATNIEQNISQQDAEIDDKRIRSGVTVSLFIH